MIAPNRSASLEPEPLALRGRERLLARLEECGIGNRRVLETLVGIPRHLFIDEALGTRAYEDSALPIGHGQTISQPYIGIVVTAAGDGRVQRAAGLDAGGG